MYLQALSSASAQHYPAGDSKGAAPGSLSARQRTRPGDVPAATPASLAAALKHSKVKKEFGPRMTVGPASGAAGGEEAVLGKDVPVISRLMDDILAGTAAVTPGNKSSKSGSGSGSHSRSSSPIDPEAHPEDPSLSEATANGPGSNLKGRVQTVEKDGTFVSANPLALRNGLTGQTPRGAALNPNAHIMAAAAGYRSPLAVTRGSIAAGARSPASGAASSGAPSPVSMAALRAQVRLNSIR
jgi:hypothetical protein